MARNTIKNKELSEEVQEEMSDALEEKVEETEDFLKSIFSQKKLSTYLVAKNLPFVAFLALLGLLYISNRHLAENTVRRIDRLGKEVKELSWDYKSLNAELMKLTTQTEIAKRADTLGLKERTEPPIKLQVVKEVKQ
ncbi:MULTISPECIES: FtsL-like putative cell division protein [Sphingobacterium]|uniref:FtsL-like putative cell division protein n=1 Tax=Sphingobacterium TaxID=28453 RepID=UPI0011F2B825|nr:MULTISPECIES: FtsL-like putative cell division protein [Sphingobacterium]MCT1523224.1 FtsL-like putative cell division protein [Sphingobacterium hotanense]WKK57738.1 FtsL-like putative cell division protein [Sphingobacterium sp. BN32]